MNQQQTKYYVIYNKIKKLYVEDTTKYFEKPEYSHIFDKNYAQVWTQASVGRARRQYCKLMGISLADVSVIEVDEQTYLSYKERIKIEERLEKYDRSLRG